MNDWLQERALAPASGGATQQPAAPPLWVDDLLSKRWWWGSLSSPSRASSPVAEQASSLSSSVPAFGPASPSLLPPTLEDLLDSRWHGGSVCDLGSSADANHHTNHAVEGQLKPQSLGWLAWLSSASRSGSSDRRNIRPRLVPNKPGTRSNGAEAAGPRLPRRPSAAKLQVHQASTGQHNGEAAGQADVAARRAGRTAAKLSANYAERRQAWRQRIEAIKAKQASRAASHSADQPAAASAGGSRVFSKHVAIPIPANAGRAGGSNTGTPHGSPARRDATLDAACAALPQLETPPIWQGFQTSEAPADFEAASEEQLRRFLQQAGWAAQAAQALAGHDALAAAARTSRGAWEVERVIVACVWPEEVLRVPRKCSDAAVLRAAYRRVSMAVHPDKCMAAGASDAMSIVAACYALLSHAAKTGSKAAVAVPTYLRQSHATHSLHASHSCGELAGSYSAAGGFAPGSFGMGGPPVGSFDAGAGPSVFVAVPPVHHQAHAAAPGQPSAQPQSWQGEQWQGVQTGAQACNPHAAPASTSWAPPSSTSWQPGQPQRHEQQQAMQPVPLRRTSSFADDQAPRRGSSTSQDHWNLHGHMSEVEDDPSMAPFSVGEDERQAGWRISHSSSEAASLASSGAGLPISETASATAAAAALPFSSRRSSAASLAGRSSSAAAPADTNASEAGQHPAVQHLDSSSLSGAHPSLQTAQRSSSAGAQVPARDVWFAGEPAGARQSVPAAATPPRAPGQAGHQQAPASHPAITAASGVTAGSSGAVHIRQKIRVKLKVRRE